MATIARKSKDYWSVKHNRIQFLEQIRSTFDIEYPSDWGKVTAKDIKKSGGSSLLSYSNNSLFQCLKSVYPGFSN